MKTSLYDLQDSVDRISSGQGQKFIASTRGTCGVPRMRDFARDPRKEIRKIEVVGLRRLPTHSSTL